MPDHWQEACLAGGAGQPCKALHDLFVTCWKAGGGGAFETPIPITEASIAAAAGELSRHGAEVPHRVAGWERVLRGLPPASQDLILGTGPRDWLLRPQSPRRLNAPAGTFELLERDLDEWCSSATAPLTTVFEERQLISPSRAATVKRFILCAATTLQSYGITTVNARLRDVVELSNFDAWLDVHDDHSRTSTLATIDAFVRIRIDLIGDDEVVGHMRRQRQGRRDAHALPQDASEQLRQMLADPRLIDLLPFALMNLASCADILAVIRCKLAAQAVGMQAALEFGLGPCEIFNLTHDGDFSLDIPARLASSLGSRLLQSVGLTSLVTQREIVRETLGAAPTRAVMASFNGTLSTNQVHDQGLTRTQTSFGLPEFPWQRLRDYVAVRMLLADPSNLMVVASLLEVRNPVLVHKRYAAFLPRASKP